MLASMTEKMFLELLMLYLWFVIIFEAQGIIDMAAANFEKLIHNLKRAQTIVDRASQDADKHTEIMNRFEARLDLTNAQMLKIDEYEKLMASMDETGDNGGPALMATFPSSTTPAQPVTATSGSTVATSSRFDVTGRQF